MKHLGTGAYVNVTTSSPRYDLACLHEKLPALSVQQGQVHIAGAVDIVSALEYHFERFLEILRGKAARAPLDNDYERYEVVAYVNRIGQFACFARSDFAISHISDAPKRIPSVMRLLPFRNKYTAHRSIDDPRSESFSEQVGHEMSLGLIGGSLWTPRPNAQQLDRKPDESMFSERWRRSKYADCFVLYQIWED